MAVQDVWELTGGSSMTLKGKGYYVWQIPNCDAGNPVSIAKFAAQANLSHVMIKIADGPSWRYNYDETIHGVDLIPPLVAELRKVGIQPWGWHYVMGYDPIGEARLAVSRTRALGLDGYVIDAEAEYKKKGRAAAAKRFMQILRTGLPDLPVALSSYRYPKTHSTFPFNEFLEMCDYAMPQVYFEGAHNPEEQLDRCVDQYMSLSNARPIIPTAPTYSRGSWRPTKDEIQRFFARSKELGLSAANAWSWDNARRSSTLDLWDAVAEFNWDPPPPPPDISEQLIDSMNKHDASRLADLYATRAAHVTGERTVVGVGAIRDWYQTLFSQMMPRSSFHLTGRSGSGNSRHFTWVAQADTGVVQNGNDILGLKDGKIHYHYTYFSLSESSW
jgi:hypothetical protein